MAPAVDIAHDDGVIGLGASQHRLHHLEPRQGDGGEAADVAPILLPRPWRPRKGCRCAALRVLDTHGGQPLR
jgi:hypothetical protein